MSTREKFLQNQGDRIAEMISQAPMGICFLKGPDHEFEIANPNFLTMFGKDENIIGKPIIDVLPALAGQGFVSLLDEVYRSGEPFFAKEKLVKADPAGLGTPVNRYLNIVYRPCRDEQEVICGIILFNTDVTDEVLARKRFEVAGNRFRTIVEKSTRIITLSSRGGRIVYVSPSVTDILGYSPDEVTRLPAAGFIHKDDVPQISAHWKCFMNADCGSIEVEVRIRHKKAGWIWCEALLTNMCREPGVNAIVTILKDISRKKIIEQQSVFKSSNLHALVNNTHDLFWSVDKELNLITFNQPYTDKVKSVTGKVVSEGARVNDFKLSNDQFQRDREFYKRAFAGQSFTAIEYSSLPDEAWSEISFYPIRQGETITGAACHSRDITSLKLAEKSLSQSEKRYRKILETAEEGIWVVDEKNIITFVNDKICKILGYSREEIIGHTNVYFKDPDEQIAALERVARRRKGVKETYDTKFLTKSSRAIAVRMAANPIWDDSGVYTGELTMLTDITEAKRSADELNRLTNRLLLATKGAGMGIWEWDILNDHLAYDNIMYKLYDMTEATSGSLYEEWLRRLHPDDKSRANAEVLAAKTGKTVYDTEFRIVWTDQSVHYIKATGITEKDAQGNIVRLVGVNWDITSWKEREQQLNLLESVITNTTDSVLVTEAQPLHEPGPRILYVNPAFTKMTGYTSEEVIGKTPRMLQGPGSDNVELHRFSEAMSKGEPIELTITNYKKNGEEFWANFCVSPVVNESGQCTHLISIERDVTARKMTELRLHGLNEDLNRQAKELAISNAELEQFAYVASHELQEPLRMVSSFLTQIEKKYGDIIDAKGKTYIDFAVDGAKRMRQIILDLLEFSRIGRTEESLEIIDLNLLLTEIQILFRRQMADKKAEIKVEELPKVHAHLSPFRQVFHNLIGNALTYSGLERPSQIRIGVSDLGNAWQFSVSDNGIGIESEYFEKVFIIFQRLHRKEEFSGTGMGLAITKKIVESWGGRIWLESEVGVGTTFHFTFIKSH